MLLQIQHQQTLTHKTRRQSRIQKKPVLSKLGTKFICTRLLEGNHSLRLHLYCMCKGLLPCSYIAKVLGDPSAFHKWQRSGYYKQGKTWQSTLGRNYMLLTSLEWSCTFPLYISCCNLHQIKSTEILRSCDVSTRRLFKAAVPISFEKQKGENSEGFD